MSAGAAQKQTMHRDDRDWRGCRGGGGQQILEARPFYIPTHPESPAGGWKCLAFPGQDSPQGEWDD